MHDLTRFLDAQDASYATALAELRRGRKRSHWIWFIFPQIQGLGHSATSRHFAIADLDEARSYLAHPVLGPRLVECTEAVCAHGSLTAEAIFGYPDWLKFRSSMTLFQAADDDPCFALALDLFYDGQRDDRTLAILGRARANGGREGD